MAEWAVSGQVEAEGPIPNWHGAVYTVMVLGQDQAENPVSWPNELVYPVLREIEAS